MVKQYPDAKTTIALAFLDDQKKASYEFYQQQPTEVASWILPAFNEGDLLLFGSVFSLRPLMRPYILKTLDLARQANVCSLYDPNFRAAHLKDLESLKPAIIDNMSKASIVRGSDEDFELICGFKNPDDIYTFVSQYCKNLLITRGAEEVIVFATGIKKSYVVPELKPISTIGAGDSFNAGLLYGLYHDAEVNGSISKLSEKGWDTILQRAISCASATCMSRENYVPVNFNPEN